MVYALNNVSLTMIVERADCARKAASQLVILAEPLLISLAYVHATLIRC